MRRKPNVLLFALLTVTMVGCTQRAPFTAGPRAAEAPPVTNSSFRIQDVHPGVHFAWISEFGSAANDYAYAVAVDEQGDSYEVGWTGGTLPGQTSAGGGDAFVRKLDPYGHTLWTRQFGTTGDDYAFGVSLDPHGNAYVVGFTDGAFPQQSNAGGDDAFVRKYTSGGRVVWTRQFGTAQGDFAYGVAVDPGGNAYVTGFTQGALTNQPSAGGDDAFVRKYDARGTAVWTQQFGTAGDDVANGISRDQHGQLYVAGRTSGAFSGQSNAGGSDAFVRKLSRDGTGLWTREFGSPSNDSASGVATDVHGNAYVAGYTGGALPNQTSAGAYDAFLRKYDAGGDATWTRQFGTAGNDAAAAVAVDRTGDAYLSGYTYGTFAGQTSTGSPDAFARRYDAKGQALWTTQFGAGAQTFAYGVAVDARGGIYLAGLTDGAFPHNTNAGGYDAFLGKLSQFSGEHHED